MKVGERIFRKPLLITLFVLVALGINTSTSYAQLAPFDPFSHLICYHVFDDLHLDSTFELVPFQNEFMPEGCRIVGGGFRLFCVPVEKMEVIPPTEGPLELPIDLAPDRICYRIECDGLTPDELEVADQFGTRTLSKFNSHLLCTPAIKCTDIEICDGIDNDCDGVVDEGFPTLGSVCIVGVGACQSNGTLVCKGDGTAVECNAVAGQPSGEVCDGVDNDCDGVTDNDVFGGACLFQDGVCVGSTQSSCVAGAFLPCGPLEFGPNFEVFEITCDGLDNDCDGSVDEDFEIGSPCIVGVGACQSNGTLVCFVGGAGVVCNAVAGQPSGEVCDGVDNDCDGQVDEGCG